MKHEGRNDTWVRRFDFFALASWLSISGWLAVVALVLYGMDFRGYYAAARVLLADGNPYDYHQVAPILLQITGEIGNNPYYYPPWFAWFFIPMAALPFQIARAVWMAFNLIIWNLGLWNLGKILNWPAKGWRRYILYSFTTFSFAWITWRYEQAGILIFVILIVAIKSIESRQWSWVGFWMALLLIKPNITMLVVTGLSLWLIRKHQWRPVLIMVLWLAVLLVVSTWITPNWYKPFFEEGFGQGLTVVLDGPDRAVALRINTTFLDWLRVLGVPPPLRMVVYGMAILIGTIVFLWIVYRSSSLLQLLSVLLLISYALTPYALQYDYAPLAIALFWALSLCVSSPKALGIGLVLAGFVFSVIFWQQNISWAYWIVVGLIALAVWGSYQETIRNSNVC